MIYLSVFQNSFSLAFSDIDFGVIFNLTCLMTEDEIKKFAEENEAIGIVEEGESYKGSQ